MAADPNAIKKVLVDDLQAAQHALRAFLAHLQGSTPLANDLQVARDARRLDGKLEKIKQSIVGMSI